MMVISSTPNAARNAGETEKLASVMLCLRGVFTVLSIMQVHLQYIRFKLIDIGQ
jgi:hypothetical protein